VVIPAYNEEKRIGEVVRRVREFIEDVVVVDDGSKDGTAQRANEAGAKVLVHGENRGKGAALKTGFEFAVREGFDAVITLDADGQHDPVEIPKFLREAEKNELQIIVGNRMGKPEGMPVVRYLTNRFTSFVISKMSGQRIPDSQSGFRLIRKEVLESLSIESSNFDAESEILIKASLAGFKIGNVPIKTIYRGDERSKINPMVDTVRFFRLVFKGMRWRRRWKM